MALFLEFVKKKNLSRLVGQCIYMLASCVSATVRNSALLQKLADLIIHFSNPELESAGELENVSNSAQANNLTIKYHQ
jgi:hypothetical protein